MKTMRNAALKLLVFIISFVCVDSVIVRAEYLIVKKDKNSFRALAKLESLKYGNAIGKILLKYQWPMCTTQHFSDEELSEIYKSVPQSSVNESNLEEAFIQKKLQDLDPDLYVVFIPTCVYELFCIVQFFEHQQKDDTSFNKVASTIFDYDQKDDKSYRFFDIYPLLILNPIQFKEKKQQNAHNKMMPYEYRTDFSNANVQTCYKALNDIFNRINDVFYVTNPKTFIELYQHPVLNPDDETARMYINNKLVSELLMLCKNCNDLTTFAQKIKENYSSLVFDLGEKLLAMDSERKLKLPGNNHVDDNGDEEMNCIEMIGTAFDANLILAVMNLEYEAYYCNKALLLRGTSFEKFETGLNEIQPLLGSTAYKPKDGSIIKAYAQHEIKPFSISFGNSLFAGSFMDCWACAYNFLQGSRLEDTVALYHNINGYGLLVDKKQYLDNFSGQLFLIPGLSSLAALFQGGAGFHPRTKVAISLQQQEKIKKDNDNKIPVIGIEQDGKPAGIEDPNHLLIITRDPLKQAELFEKYIAENGRLIQASSELSPEDKRAREKLATSAKDAAEYHHALQTTVPKLKKYVQSYKERKTQAKQPKQDIGKQGKQPKTVPEPIKNSKLLINALELASMLKK